MPTAAVGALSGRIHAMGSRAALGLGSRCCGCGVAEIWSRVQVLTNTCSRVRLWWGTECAVCRGHVALGLNCEVHTLVLHVVGEGERGSRSVGGWSLVIPSGFGIGGGWVGQSVGWSVGRSVWEGGRRDVSYVAVLHTHMVP